VTDVTVSRLWLDFKDEDYTDSVCLLLPDGHATIVDVEFFEWASTIRWYVLGRCIFATEYFAGIKVKSRRTKTHWLHRDAIAFGLDSVQSWNLNRLLNRRDVDHANRNPWDNRRRNLRPATRSQNCQNRTGLPETSSKYKGVSRVVVRGKVVWKARATLRGRRFHLGTFKDESQAARAYNRFIRETCPEFGFINPISISFDETHQ
jgi:hypothetical protein